MSNQNIPNDNKQIIQSNVGDYKGNLWETFNIDLESNEGVIKTAPRLTPVLTADEISDELVQALTIFDGKYYVVTDDRVTVCSTNSDPTDADNWSNISTLGLEDLGFETDAVSLGNLLLISLGTDIMSYDGTTKVDDWWTNTVVSDALTSTKPHIMDVTRSGTDTVFITDANNIRYYNSDAGATIITVDSSMTTSCLTPSLDRMWVGSYTEVESNAYVYEVQVGNDTYNQSYPVDGRACLTMFSYKNTPFAITERGYIQVFNGAGFQTVAQFPWATESKVMQGVRPGLVQDTSVSRAIHPKGAKVEGKYCYIFVDTEDEYNPGELLNNRSASGVWVLNLETYSLTHRGGLTVSSTDNGWSKVTRSGPLLITNTPETRLMVGGQVNNTTESVWMETTPSYGYFTTVRHESNSIADAFEAFTIKADTLDTGESIKVKYKDVTLPNFPLIISDITWLDTNKFTTTNAFTGVAVGDEVNIKAGANAGHLVHITAIEGTTTKTVTVDATFGVLNDTSDVQIDRWKLIDKTYTSADGEYCKFGDGKTSPSRQYKVVMTGDVTIREVISKSNNKEGH